MTRLQAMQLRIMGFGGIGSPPFAAPGKPTSAGEIIRGLRAALAVEHKARLAAESRLRGVLAEIARRPPVQAPPPPPVFERPALPAARSTVEVEAEVMSEGGLAAMRSQIMEEGEDVDVEEE